MKFSISRVLPKGLFFRSVSVLVSGAVGAQFIVILAAPLLTRLYYPEDFGLLAIFAGLLAIVTVIASLRYSLAIPLPEKDEKAASVLVLSLVVVLGISALSTLVVVLFAEDIAAVLNTPALADYLWLLPLGVLMSGAYQGFNFWAIRTKAFPLVARTRIAQSVSAVSVQLMGYGLGPMALLLGQIASQAAGFATLSKVVLSTNGDMIKAVRPVDIIQAANRYRRFPIYSTWEGIFNTASVQFPPILFAALFSLEAAGIFSLAHRVLSVPSSMVGVAVGQVFFSKATEAYRDGGLARLVENVHERLTLFVMPPMLLLVIFGPELFAWVFGEVWRQAGVFAQWMAPWLYFQFTTSPLTSITSAIEKQRHGALLQIALFAIRVVSIIIGSVTGGLIGSVILFSLASAFWYWIILLWILRVTENPLIPVLSHDIKAFGWSALIVIPLYVSWHCDVRGATLVLLGALLTMFYVLRIYWHRTR